MSSASHAPMFVRELGLPQRFILYAVVCLVVMAADTRYDTLAFLRTGIATVLHPVQAVMAKPFVFLQEAFGFFEVHGQVVRENAELRTEQRHLQVALQDQIRLRSENEQLRALLGLPKPPGYTGLAVEIVQALADPFARKVLVNRGSLHGIVAGSPVVDSLGLVGQITRVYPASSEVTLLTSREQAAPVQSVRTGLRLIVSGYGQDRLLQVRFLDMHADLRPGDELVTSGLDGVYPAGIQVARVLRIEPPRHTPFASALCTPLAGVSEQRHLLVLQRDDAAQPTPAEPEPPAQAKRKRP